MAGLRSDVCRSEATSVPVSTHEVNGLFLPGSHVVQSQVDKVSPWGVWNEVAACAGILCASC